MRSETVKFSIPLLSKSFQKNLSHPNIIRFFGIHLQVQFTSLQFKFYWPDIYHMKHLFVEVFLQVFIIHIFFIFVFSFKGKLWWLLICYKWNTNAISNATLVFMSYRNDLPQQKALTMSLIKFHNTVYFCSNFTKVSNNFCKCSFPTNIYWWVWSSRVNFPDFNYAFPEKYFYKGIL